MKFSGTDCKNFTHKDRGTLTDDKKRWVTDCGRENCVDREDCDGKQIVAGVETHFEPKQY